jgi:nucleoside-diphosphate-sugar epimerase
VCAALLAAGYRVTAVSRRGTAVPAGCRLGRPDGLGALLAARPAVVVNAAGALWGATQEEMVASNVTLAGRLARALARLAVPPRLVHLGSVYEYGSQPPGAELCEDTRPNPQAGYARTKLRGTEQALRAPNAVVLRVSTAVGPGAPAQSLFGLVARRLVAGGAMLELPALPGERDFVHVADVADAVLAAARAPAASGVLNIGGGTLTPVRALVDRLIAISGVPVAVTTRPDDEGPRRDAGIAANRVVIDAARRVVGWAPRRTLTDALCALWRETVRTSGANRVPLQP